MRTRFAFAVSLSLSALGCPLGAQSKPARAQEVALELNLNARFGRMELAVEHVAPTARDAFIEKRKGWGTTVRVADYDMTGLRMLKGDEDCETTVRVAWFRTSENDLRTTTVKQKWHDFKGAWKLTEEVRVDGDTGLLGEPPALKGTVLEVPARRAQFPTITLGSGNTRALGASDLPAPDAADAPSSGPPLTDPPAEMPRLR